MNSLFHKDLIDVHIEVEDYEKLFQYMFNVLKKEEYVTKEFLAGLLNREIKFPTGLELGGYGVAIPHTDPKYIIKPFVYVVTLNQGISFFRMDNVNKKVSVNTVFLLGLNTGDEQIKMLQKLMAFIQNKSLMNNLYNTDNVEKVLNIIQNNFESAS